jgi:amino acid transporter
VAVAIVQLVVSLGLLLIASTRADLPPWGGPLDGIIAFTLVGTGLLIWRRAGDRAGLREFRIGHGVAAVLPALVLAAIWWYRDSLDFNILLPGLAWRTWLVLYSLPFALTLLSGKARPASR